MMAMQKEKPNVILINCDDLGYGDLGCYGSKVNKSPFIDSLSEKGVKFTSCYAPAPICSPSRAALMTGSYPPRVGINLVLFPGDKTGLNPSEYTIGKLFSDNGYRTMIVGKWHCGDQQAFLPTNFGFDHYWGLPYSNDMGMQKRKDGAAFPPLPLMSDQTVSQKQPDQCALTERYTEKCCEFINSCGDSPFFLYFAQMHVHLPLYAAKRFVEMSQNGDFGACVASLDWACSAIYDTVRSRGLLDNTIFIFTSDNGSRGDHGASNYPLKGGKFTTWEGGLRVPFIAYWKDHTVSRVSDALISHIDLLPTFASMLKSKLPDVKIDGEDISRVLFSDSDDGRESFAYYSHSGRLDAVRNRRYKLHCYKDGQPVRLMYDMETDISEQNNIYDENSPQTRQLQQLFGQLSESCGNTLDGTAGENMRAAGHVENPVYLCEYDPQCPYMVAEYDKDDVG